MNELNERFIMTPIALLEIPEFIRYFDSKPIGAIYRVLCSRVWRKPKEALRKSSSKRIRLLTEQYESGLLSSMHTLKTLSEAVGYDERSVRRQLKDLLLLGLIDQEKIMGEVFYIVGETRLRGRDKAFLGVGSSNESFYINRWRDFVNYSSEYSPETLDLFKSELVSFFKNGQKCQILLTDLSKISNLNDLRNLVSDANSEDDNDPLIDKGIQLNSTGLDLNDKVDFNRYELNRIKNEARKELLDAVEVKEIFDLARDSLSSSALTLEEINLILANHVPPSFKKYEKLPRFAISLDSVSTDEAYKDHTRLVIIWSSLREDVSGVYIKSSQREYSKITALFKNLLNQYSFEQVLWTIKKVAYNGGPDLEFLAKGAQTVAHIVSKNSKQFHELKNESDRIKNSSNRTAQNDEFPSKNYYFEDPFGDDFVETPAYLILNSGGNNE